MAKQALPVKRRTRVLFLAGKCIREPRPCSDFGHAGPLVDTGWGWADLGTCRTCGDTITRAQIARAA